MSAQNKTKINNDAAVNHFDQALRLASTITSSFLKDRASDYAESASILYEATKNKAVPNDIKNTLHYYGKKARLLDMILSIANAANYLSAEDRAAGEKIRQIVKGELQPQVQHQTDGKIIAPGLSGSVATHSTLGRRLAGLFARYVPPAGHAKASAPVLNRNDSEALSDLATTLIDNNQFDEAIAMYQKGLNAKPNDSALLAGLGTAYLMKGDDESALSKLKEALKISPYSAEIHARLGTYYELHGELEDAALSYGKATQLSQQYPLAIARLGVVLCQQRKDEQGLALINKALRQQPNNMEFIRSKSYALLAAGQYEEGWALYENGLKLSTWRTTDLIADKPIWNGQPIRDKKLLILSEQGLGDAIQFVRYAALCKLLVGKVYVLCRPPLQRLFENCPAVDKVFTSIGKWQFDQQISMMSLPSIFKTSVATVPTTIPYINIPASLVKDWSNKLGLPDNRLKVGLVWAGSALDKTVRGDLRAKRRNIGLQKLLPLFDNKNVAFYNLQIGDDMAQIDSLNLRNRMIDVMPDVKDMLDTAAIIANLDLVITVDTSVAHLAGAIGKPVWILPRYDADWRWLHNRTDNPWYPTARVFNQPQSGDWDSVMRDVTEALEEISA